MSFHQDLGASLEAINVRLQREPQMSDIDACALELTDVGTQITAAIEAQFLSLTEPSAA